MSSSRAEACQGEVSPAPFSLTAHTPTCSLSAVIVWFQPAETGANLLPDHSWVRGRQIFIRGGENKQQLLSLNALLNLFCRHLRVAASRDTAQDKCFAASGGHAGRFVPFYHLSHLASAVGCKLILKRQRGEKMQLKWVLPFEQAQSLPPLHGTRECGWLRGRCRSGNPNHRRQRFT